MSWIGWAITIVVNLPVYFVVGRVFFKNWEEFEESIAYLFQPDIFSAFSGEFWDDWWATLKFGLWTGSCGYLTFAEVRYIIKPHILPMFG